jgi:hypothetical protein
MLQEIGGDVQSSNPKEVDQEGIVAAPQMPMIQMMPMPNYGYPPPQMQQPMQPMQFPVMAPQGAAYFQMGTA